MPPTSSHDFQKAAGQRFTTAETLLREKLTLDAQYIGGYTVECSLKALTLFCTPEANKTETLKRITTGASMHKPDVLLGELRDRGIALPRARRSARGRSHRGQSDGRWGNRPERKEVVSA